MRELRKGDRVVAREGAKTASGYDVSGDTAVVRSLHSLWGPKFITAYLDKEKRGGFFNFYKDDLTRIPKHRSDEPLDPHGYAAAFENLSHDIGRAIPYFGTKHRAEGAAN